LLDHNETDLLERWLVAIEPIDFALQSARNAGRSAPLRVINNQKCLEEYSAQLNSGWQARLIKILRAG
jgi:hypothetical protein